MTDIAQFKSMSKQALSHYLLEVKQEYTKQLSNLLVPVMYEGLMSIYNEAKKIKKESPMKTFQILLSRIPQWNQSIITNEYQRIISRTQCDWINDLITAVFISHAKILSSIKTKKNSKTLNLKIPNGDYFIHKAYIECARQFWKNPYLFYDDVTTVEYQRNLRETELIIEQSINETIRKLLPVKNILQQYIALDESDSSSSEEEEVETTVDDEEKQPSKKKRAVEEDEDPAKYDEEYITSSITEKDRRKLERSVKKEVSKAHPAKDDDNYSVVSVSNDLPTRKKIIKPQVVEKPTVADEPASVVIDNSVEIIKEPSVVQSTRSLEASVNISESHGGEPSKLKEQIDLYESLDEHNSHDISLGEDLHPYPPKLESLDETVGEIVSRSRSHSEGGEGKRSHHSKEGGEGKRSHHSKEGGEGKRSHHSKEGGEGKRSHHSKEGGEGKRSVILNEHDMDEFDKYSMNTKLDMTYTHSVDMGPSAPHHPHGSMKIDIDDIPAVETPSVSEPPSISVEQPKVPEIKTVVIKMPTSAVEATQQKPAFAAKGALGKKRDMRKAYSFFD